MVADLKADRDPCSNVKADPQSYKTSLRKLFACGDLRRVRPLVVSACPPKAV